MSKRVSVDFEESFCLSHLQNIFEEDRYKQCKEEKKNYANKRGNQKEKPRNDIEHIDNMRFSGSFMNILRVVLPDDYYIFRHISDAFFKMESECKCEREAYATDMQNAVKGGDICGGCKRIFEKKAKNCVYTNCFCHEYSLEHPEYYSSYEGGEIKSENNDEFYYLSKNLNLPPYIVEERGHGKLYDIHPNTMFSILVNKHKSNYAYKTKEEFKSGKKVIKGVTKGVAGPVNRAVHYLDLIDTISEILIKVLDKFDNSIHKVYGLDFEKAKSMILEKKESISRQNKKSNESHYTLIDACENVEKAKMKMIALIEERKNEDDYKEFYKNEVSDDQWFVYAILFQAIIGGASCKELFCTDNNLKYAGENIRNIEEVKER